jgi:hypothetical protein
VNLRPGIRFEWDNAAIYGTIRGAKSFYCPVKDGWLSRSGNVSQTWQFNVLV